MRRVAIIGPCGAGKSTLAIELARVTGLPPYHIDRLNWKPGWVDSSREELSVRLEAIVAEDRWIIDGNYSGTMHLRLPRADTVIFLDYSRWIYRWRVLKRWYTHRGRTRPDMTEGCDERLDLEFLRYVWRFDRDARPRLLAKLNELIEAQNLIHLRHPREATSFLREVERQYRSSVGMPE